MANCESRQRFEAVKDALMYTKTQNLEEMKLKKEDGMKAWFLKSIDEGSDYEESSSDSETDTSSEHEVSDGDDDGEGDEGEGDDGNEGDTEETDYEDEPNENGKRGRNSSGTSRRVRPRT
ncbi:MAG: hypothetical protein KGL39_01070 [Patescibacteria group bacterium]|nr:hypothetical protein [Patescibacteria group bacterium]